MGDETIQSFRKKDGVMQGFSKFTFKGPNGNYHQRQKVRNHCYYKTCLLLYITIQLDLCSIIIFMTSSVRTCVYEN